MFSKILQSQKEYFKTGRTKQLNKRVKDLKKLRSIILDNDEKIIDAIKKDIGRSPTETFTSEIYIALKELDLLIKNLKRWSRPARAKTPLLLKPAKSYIYHEPYGSVLILGSWNYPFQLLASPLIGAMAAGNCAVVKPSEVSHNTAELLSELINDNFKSNYIYCARGGADTAEELLKLDFDYIFFTGSTNIGKRVMKAASEKLIPITLELGGKCPCIVESDTDIKKAARRITWGKFFNLGQNCIAPDYVYAHRSIKSKLVSEIHRNIGEFYGEDPSKSPDYGRIIDKRHFDRLIALISKRSIGDIKTDKEDLYIGPVVIDDASWDDEFMKEEIFGPVLPVLGYEKIQDALERIKKMSKPLEIYLFCSSRKTVDYVIENTSSGRVTVNDVLLQAASNYLPFGGVGLSGIGRYRGKASFLEFSNQKSVMKRGLSFDWRYRYPPYGIEFKRLKKFFRFF